jgi:uncharacterized protein
MKEFLKFLLANIVDQPEAVTIEEKEDENGLILLVNVAEDDRGKVIGKEGKVIFALRNLLNIKAQKENKRVFLQLNF